MSTDVPTAAERPMRADGRRNRELVLAAAQAAFAEGGPDVAVAEIAKRAGVGTATLFRHFATKDDLLAAVLEQMFAQIGADIDEAAQIEDPWDSFVASITVFAEMQATNMAFLRSAGPEILAQPRFAETTAAMTERMNAMIERGQAAGVVRPDLEHTDLAFVLSAIGGATEHCGTPVTTPDLWRRYLGLILDGLRPEGAHPLAPPALTYDELVEVKYQALQNKR